MIDFIGFSFMSILIGVTSNHAIVIVAHFLDESDKKMKHSFITITCKNIDVKLRLINEEKDRIYTCFYTYRLGAEYVDWSRR